MNKNTKTDLRGMWLLNLFSIIFFAWLAYKSYNKITKYETEGGFLSLPKFLMLMYELVGKWGVVGVWLLGILYNIVKGAMSLAQQKMPDEAFTSSTKK